MMEEEQSIEISSVAPLGFQNDDVQSLNSDDAATVESFNNSGGRTRIVKLAVAGLAVASVAIGLGVGFGAKNNANANLSASSAKVNEAGGAVSSFDCAGELAASSGKVSLAALARVSVRGCRIGPTVKPLTTHRLSHHSPLFNLRAASPAVALAAPAQAAAR